MVRALFIAFDTCLSSSTGFPVVSVFLTFEAPQGNRDVLLKSLKTIADLHLLGRVELVKCQDVRVGLDSLLAFSDEDSTYVCNPLFSQGSFYLLFCNQHQLPTPDKSLGNVEFLMQVGSAFRRMKIFIFCAFCLSPAVHLNKQVDISFFLSVLWVSHVEITFSMRERENLAWQTSSKDSITMNLGKSAASFSEPDSDRFRFFLFKDSIYDIQYIFGWLCAPPATTESNLCWE